MRTKPSEGLFQYGTVLIPGKAVYFREKGGCPKEYTVKDSFSVLYFSKDLAVGFANAIIKDGVLMDLELFVKPRHRRMGVSMCMFRRLVQDTETIHTAKIRVASRYGYTWALAAQRDYPLINWHVAIDESVKKIDLREERRKRGLRKHG